jgi:hypothetical protein
MIRRFAQLCFTALPAAVTMAVVPARAAKPATTAPVFVIVNGAAGEEQYGQVFTRQMAAWEKAAAAAGARAIVVGRDSPGPAADRTLLEQALAAEPRDGNHPLWLVLIGHGTFDKREARFNLRGDDVTATDLAAWLQPIQRPLAVINTTSASAPFVAKLSAPGRIVITATRSGNERNYTRFGASLAGALDDPAADLDQDGQTSLLEAFLAASAKVVEFYKTEGRLATEHALIDDNGDGLGTPAAWFRGLRATKKPRDAAALDGTRAHQWTLTPDPDDAARSPEWRARRDALETSIAALRDTKADIPAADYYRQLEALLLDLAKHYESASGAAAAKGR